MASLDPLVSALISLCKREGGERFVADKAVVSAENLLQITNGVKLPSGNPRGVGPRLRDKLTKAYPDWMQSIDQQQALDVQRQSAPPSAAPMSAECQVICSLFSGLPADQRIRDDTLMEIVAVIKRAKDPPSHQERPGQATGTR